MIQFSNIDKLCLILPLTKTSLLQLWSRMLNNGLLAEKNPFIFFLNTGIVIAFLDMLVNEALKRERTVMRITKLKAR